MLGVLWVVAPTLRGSVGKLWGVLSSPSDWQLRDRSQELSGGGVVKTLYLHFRRYGIQFLVGELRSHLLCGAAKKIFFK